MELQELVEKIVAAEWKMFHTVNGDDRTDCQNDDVTFAAMRKAQFSSWSRKALKSYLSDLEEAEIDGRSLVREKYIWMMKSTDKEGYEHFKGELPAVSVEKELLVRELWHHMLAQTQRMREVYPVLAMGGRPLYASEEKYGETSIETYQTGELYTYSETTLRALLEHMLELEEKGIDLVSVIQENSVTCLGFASMEEAEKAMAGQLSRQIGDTVCASCGARELYNM